ncbi:MAG TPA: class II aldolase/adducin family protein, partial [Mycobacteriales bacterium]|nr:class II aldolase/adducin family protein [Mycobacteriales bacterium]
YLRTVRVTGYHHPGTAELARAGAEAIADRTCDCVVLAHHGCSVVADSVELAGKRALNLEEAAAATYRALLLGDRHTVCPPAYAQRLSSLQAGTH